MKTNKQNNNELCFLLSCIMKTVLKDSFYQTKFLYQKTNLLLDMKTHVSSTSFPQTKPQEIDLSKDHLDLQ